MKIVLIILVIFVLAIGSLVIFVMSYSSRLGKPVNETLSDSYYYHATKNLIIYSPMGNTFELGYFEMEADSASFVVVARDFGKDNQSVYWKGHRTQADPVSFVVDSNHIPKDKLHVYFPDKYATSIFVIDGADPATYQMLPILNDRFYNYWAVDATSFFLDGRKVEVDRASFVRLSASIAKDTSFVYSIEPSDSISVGSPGATILVRREKKPEGEPIVINESHVQFGNSIIYVGWKNKFALLEFDKINSIRFVDERNIWVDNILVSDGKKKEGVDEASLEIIRKDFFKDKSSVYYDGEKITLANPQTFEVVYEDYSKDNQYVFYKLEVLEGVNPNTFTYKFASGIATDGKLKYRDGQLVKNKK